jgi:hypothetical protein
MTQIELSLNDVNSVFTKFLAWMSETGERTSP